MRNSELGRLKAALDLEAPHPHPGLATSVLSKRADPARRPGWAIAAVLAVAFVAVLLFLGLLRPVPTASVVPASSPSVPLAPTSLPVIPTEPPVTPPPASPEHALVLAYHQAIDEAYAAVAEAQTSVISDCASITRMGADCRPRLQAFADTVSPFETKLLSVAVPPCFGGVHRRFHEGLMVARQGARQVIASIDADDRNERTAGFSNMRQGLTKQRNAVLEYHTDLDYGTLGCP